MPSRPLDTPNAPPAAGPYTPAVRAGDWIACAGQVGLDPTTGSLVDGGVEAQIRQVMANLAAVLGDCGATFEDLVKTTVFVTDLGDGATVNAVYAAALGDHRPARSTVQVAGLPLGAVVEVECWAYVPEQPAR